MTSQNTSGTFDNDKHPKLVNDRYEVISKLGEGGMGIVYKAFDPKLYQDVSIKLLKNIGDMEESARRFQKEAKAASQLSHPNLAPVLDFGITDDGVLFMVSRFIEGDTLTRVIKQEGALSLEDGLSIINQIADCMAYIHSKGILHRDLKAGNVIVRRSEEGTTAFVLDFGIAKLVEEHILEEGITRAGTILGSPSYMSPEQGRGSEMDFRSDIYSLGCLAFQIFTGKLPYHSDTVFDIINLHIEAPIPEFDFDSQDSNIPEEVEAAVRQMIAKDPSDRIQSMNEVRDTFASFLETYAPKHNWVVQKQEEPQTLFGNLSSFSTKTSNQAKIIIGFIFIFIAGVGLNQLSQAIPRWLSHDKPSNKTISKHQIKETLPLAQLRDTVDEVIKKDATFHKAHYPMFGHRDTYIAVGSNPENMPAWSELKDKEKPFVLVIQSPYLKDSDLTQILMLKNLIGLSMSLEDGVTEEQLQKISKKKTLQVLKLVRAKQLEPGDYKLLRNLPNLTYLLIDDSNLNLEKAIEIARIKTLIELYIDNDKQLSDKAVIYLASHLKSLTSFGVSDSRISNQSLKAIAKATNIKSLKLAGTDITDDGITQLVKSKSKISYIDLGKTKITRAGFLQLTKLKNLEEVVLGLNPNLKKEEIQFLKKTTKFKVRTLYRSMKEMSTFWDL